MKTSVEVITPKKAAEMLATNTNNRRLSKAAVTNYAHQIKNGRWKLNGESIKFDHKGNLCDGQHRLAAVVEADTAVKMSVTRDLPADTIRTLDIGKKRTNADHLEIYGVQGNADLAVVAAAIRLISYFSTGKYVQHKLAVSPSDAIQFVDENKGLLHAEQRVPKQVGKFMPRSVAVAMYFLFSKINREKADLFFVALGEGANLKAGNPALTLRNKLLFMAANKSGNAEKRQIIAYTCRAFDAYINNEAIQQLNFDPQREINLPKIKSASVKEKK